MASIEIPEALDKEEAKKTLERKAKHKDNSPSRKSGSSDDSDLDKFLILSGVLLGLGWALNELSQAVLSLFWWQ